MSPHARTAAPFAFITASLLAGCAQPAASPTATTATVEPSAASIAAPEQPAERCINLGSTIFQSGSREFAPGAEETVNDELADLPPGTEVRIEVFGEGRHPLPRHPVTGGEPRLSQLRAKALQSLLESRGLIVKEALGRGRDKVDGRPADRRAEVYVVGR